MKKPTLNLTFTLCFIALAWIQSLGQTAITVGSGSYASFPPTHEMDGTFTTLAQNAEIDVAPGETRAIPTNDWWTNLIYDENDQIGGQLWAMPLVVDPTVDGLSIFNPYKWNADGTNLSVDYPVVLKGAGFVANKSIVTNWSDWTVDVKLYQDINNKFINFTSAHGIPYLWTNCVGFVPQIECYHGATYMNSAGANITFPFTGEYFVIKYWDTFYGVHLPPGSNVTQGGTTGNLLTVNFPAGQNYIIFSALPNAAAGATMHTNAYVKPTNSTVNWSYNTSAGTMTTTWNLTTTNLRGAATNTVMQGFLPHQYRTATASNVAYNGINFSQSRGLLKMAVGNNFSFTYKFNGILPHYKAPVTISADATPYDASKMNTLINNYTTEILKTTPYGAADTYWGGKDLVRIAKYMLMAKETNNANYTTLMNALKNSMANWLTYTPGETERYFAWYPKWKALIGFNESYYSGVFTDNHFHYGYFIQAAALLAMADPDWVSQYQGILTMIAKQYANWDRADGNFPFLRTFDPWMGHSYAGGVSSPTGNNQESTSEAVQSWHALFFLGAQFNNTAMRDAGAFGYMYETKATHEYWFNRNNDVWPATYNSAHDVVGILWPGGYVYGTYFGIDPQWIHGIQMLPVSPGFHHFNQAFTKAQAQSYYNTLMNELYTFNLAQGNTARTDGGVVTEAEVGNDWANVLLGFRMLFDPQYVTQKLNQYWNSSDQEEKDVILYPYEGGTTYYYAHALQNLGEYRTDYSMSIPTSAAFFNAATGQTNYVVYNPLNSAQTCTVYQNGAQVTSFSVPARTLYSSLTPNTNTPPTASITSPANNATFTAPASITINATASDPGGSITSVAFYNGSTLLGTDTSSPYSYTWSNVAAGSYTITARATDNGGLIGTSSAVNITVGTGGTNLALNKPTTVSSTENAGTPGSSAVDGNGGTRWSSAAADPQWIYVDLQATYNVNRVKVTWETALGKDYQIQIAAAAAGPWTTMRTIAGNTALVNDNTGLAGSGRYIRIYGTARGTAYGYSIWELEAYGTSGPSNVAPTANAGADKSVTLPTNSVVINGSGSDSDGTISSYAWTRISGPNTPTLTNANTANLTASGLIAGTYVFRLTVTDNGGATGTDDVNVVVSNATTTNLALNKPTTTSSTEAVGTPGSAAVDGNATTTRWSSAFSDPQWIYVDLGASYNVNRVKVTWEGAYGKDYLVQIATAAAGPWTTMKTITGNTVLVNDHTGIAGTGRYVRIYGTARGTAYGYSIYELEVYGSPAARMALEETTSDNHAVNFYPNPADDLIYLEGVEEGTNISIFNLTGSESLHKKVSNKSVDVSPLQPGAYILRVNSVNKKLIKK
jgi:endoglucanase Acf2